LSQGSQIPETGRNDPIVAEQFGVGCRRRIENVEYAD
jgi:hypothetical protein